MTDQERKNRATRIREKRLRELEQQNKDLLKRQSELENISKRYPPLILTLLKKLKRIDPWNTVANMDPINCTFVTYFKLRQALKLNNDELRMTVNSKHAWVEFKYDDKWWIFDPIAIKNLNLGYPVKLKTHADKEEYLELSRYYYNCDEYFEKYEQKIDFTKDEAKIIAMEDGGLYSVFKINYH